MKLSTRSIQLREGLIIRITILLLVTLTCFPSIGIAAWQAPVEIVRGNWGTNIGQFNLKQGGTTDIFPKDIGVDKEGSIAIADVANKRILIYNSDGTILRAIEKPAEIHVTYWPRSLLVHSSGNSLLANLYIYNYDGSILNKINIKRTERFISTHNYVISDIDNNKYYLYSPSGELQKTSTQRPLELGSFQSRRKMPDGSYLTTIKYDDNIFRVIAPNMLEYFTRDMSGYFYGVIMAGTGDEQHYRVYKYNTCGNILGSVDLPADNIIEEPENPPAPTPDITFVAEYGKPLISPNGDVYAWKRTPETYSILKWTWKDDINSKDNSCKEEGN